MKLIAIGDIHGRDIWKEIVNQEFDKCVFIGDYFDSFDIPGDVQLNNFLDIIEFKKNNVDKVVLLIGNHDFHYLDFNEHYSGFQTGYQFQIKELLNKNLDYLQMAYQYDKYLFTHAGISIQWLKNNGWIGENYVNYVNDLWKYKPNSFKFVGYSPYGDDKNASPIWIRPNSLRSANYDSLRIENIQIVGHTRQIGGIDIEGKTTGGRYYFIDVLDNQNKQYLIIDNNKVKLGSGLEKES